MLHVYNIILSGMGKKSRESKEIDSSGLLLFIYNNRAALLVITIAALILSVVVSLLITPRYRSAVVLYPTTLTGVSQSLSVPSPLRGQIMRFGQESDAERLLQILNSETVRSRIIDKYDLFSHYGIKERSRFPRTELNKKFDKNVRFRKTEFMAIVIEVLDSDPAMAASMANDIAVYADSVMNNILMDKAISTYQIIGEEYRRMKSEIDRTEDSLRTIRRLGVVHYEAQAEVMNNAYATAILNKDSAGISFFRERLRTLSAYGGAYVSLRERLEFLNEKFSDFQSVYDAARVDAEKSVPYTLIVDRAYEAEKKSYPVRSLIVVVSTISAFLFTLFMLLVADAVQSRVPVKINTAAKSKESAKSKDSVKINTAAKSKDSVKSNTPAKGKDSVKSNTPVKTKKS